MKRITVLDLGDWDITLKEVLFSVLIFGILFGIGSLISNHISGLVDSEKLIYRQASQITETNDFCYAIETGFGNSFFQGMIKANFPVTNNKIKGKWMHIIEEHESYNMHTRTVTVTDSKGRTHTRFETYWSWDLVNRIQYGTPTVNLMGRNFATGKFEIDCPRSHFMVPNGYHKRIQFYCLPERMNVVGFADLLPTYPNDTGNKTQLYADRDIQWLYDDYTSIYWNSYFWIGWTVLMIFVIFLFCYFSNEWLEDKGETKEDEWRRKYGKYSNRWKYYR